MTKTLLFFIFQVFAICVKNVKSVNHKKSFTINHVNIPVGLRTNKHRKFAYVDLRRNKSEEGRRNLLEGNLSRQKCPLRKVSLKGLIGVTGISIPLFLASLLIYNKLRFDNKNLSDAEKIMGKYLYKHEKNLFFGNNYDDEKPYNIFYIISNIYNNVITFINFYINVKKVCTKENANEYTILFFHSYNVDKFLRARNIKTYADRLKDIYKEINKNNNVNVVYVPLDSKLLFNIKHFSNMNNWYSVLFHDKRHILKLIKNYNIMNIPTMVLLDKNMNIINDNINYLLLYESKHFPYKNVNNFTYINHLYDKNNNKYNFKDLNSDYIVFYFNNDKDNKEDMQSLLRIKKKLAKKNIKLDIIYIKDMERKKGGKNNKSSADNVIGSSSKKDDPSEGTKEEHNNDNSSSNNNNENKNNINHNNGGNGDNNNKNNKNGKGEKEDKQDNSNKETFSLNNGKYSDTNEDKGSANYLDDVYYLGSQENNAIYKLLLYDIFDVTFKPVSILANKKGNILNKYINVSKKDNEISTFILNNHKSLNEQVNEKNYMFKYDNISNLSNLNVFAPIFILFSEKLDFDLLNQYDSLIEEYSKNRKGKRINFYFLLNEDKKYEALKKLCSVNDTTQVLILDLFNQKLFKENINNINIIQKINGKSVINKENFFNFVNRYYNDDLYSSTIVLTKEA
ncbi:thioredoxin-like protein [Plasmodium brasilianum]|uniref:Thioredoxin-like protein, putative n=3 Tax=Plasmodium (Plasmodium) TaxID=418103 RepID=A0A1D3TD95_PLAMA|nr:thioredoxin-like protein, putative [Plasmodium malariae]KAI4835811.1 thioredoxin-like protein [Plasmodium brasilianum]SCP02750.1 thioredoxin-like protein, putative [Plasmodium malariae]